MPELPEVETVRRQLEPEVVGRTIAAAEVLDERWTRPELPARIEEALTGRAIESVGRRGKYLVVGLDDGSALVMHLRMTGNLLIREPGADAVADLMDTDRARRPAPVRVAARMPATCGRGWCSTTAPSSGSPTRAASATPSSWPPTSSTRYFASRLGVEPLGGELTPKALLELAAGRRAPLKSFLLDQSRDRGDRQHLRRRGAVPRPICIRSRRPARCGSSTRRSCATGSSTRSRPGSPTGGSSIDDYRDARGERGSMQDEFLVHTREGEPCLRCGETIRRVVVAGRSTYFCPGCQRRLRARPRRRPAQRR